MEVNRLRGSFHYRHLAAVFDGFMQKTVGVRGFWRRANGRLAFYTDAIFDRRQHRACFSVGFGQSET